MTTLEKTKTIPKNKGSSKQKGGTLALLMSYNWSVNLTAVDRWLIFLFRAVSHFFSIYTKYFGKFNDGIFCSFLSVYDLNSPWRYDEWKVEYIFSL